MILYISVLWKLNDDNDNDEYNGSLIASFSHSSLMDLLFYFFVPYRLSIYIYVHIYIYSSFDSIPLCVYVCVEILRTFCSISVSVGMYYLYKRIVI